MHKFTIKFISTMKEDFLHYVWRFQYFTKQKLQTTTGEPLRIIHQGFLNTDSGPDFSNAKIQIGSLEWAGNVEIHIKASDWVKHQHDDDQSYQNVILHVVWEDDHTIYRADGSSIPTLALSQRVDTRLQEKYWALLQNAEQIPCANTFPDISSLTKMTMLDKVIVNRLERKATELLNWHQKYQADWEEIAYQWVVQHFGFKTNNPSFLQLAQSIPLKLFQKHGNQLLQIEAFLFGISGLLNEASVDDDYVKALRREYHFLQHKYRLSDAAMESNQWKFMRMRPSNFPTIRLAQLGMLLFTQKSFFSKFLFTESPERLLKIFEVTQSEYWQKHYDFGKTSKKKLEGMGKSSQVNLLINCVAPLLVAYGIYKDNTKYTDRALELLEQLPAEQNKIVRSWKQLGLEVKSAFDSQASLELYNQFCQKNKCLSCSIGVKIIGN